MWWLWWGCLCILQHLAKLQVLRRWIMRRMCYSLWSVSTRSIPTNMQYGPLYLNASPYLSSLSFSCGIVLCTNSQDTKFVVECEKKYMSPFLLSCLLGIRIQRSNNRANLPRSSLNNFIIMIIHWNMVLTLLTNLLFRTEFKTLRLCVVPRTTW